MVRETRHLWVGNLPDNIREDRIREHFKRYGRVQNVKILPKGSAEGSVVVAGSTGGGVCATVAFMDIRSAAKAHGAEHTLDERPLSTEYYEPAAIPAPSPSAGSSPAGSGYSTGSGSIGSHSQPNAQLQQRFGGNVDRSSDDQNIGSSLGSTSIPVGASSASSTPASIGAAVSAGAWRPSTPAYVRERYRNGPTSYGGGVGGVGGAGAAATASVGERRVVRQRRRSGSAVSSCSDSSRSSSSSGRSSSGESSGPASGRRVRRRTEPVLALCVRNLPARSSDSSLKDGLYHEYKKHGKVAWVKIHGQNQDRYAVVRFKRSSDAQKALEVSQDKLFFGCKISVAPYSGADIADVEESEEYHPKTSRTLFIGNLDKDATAAVIRDKFKRFGRIIDVDVKKQSTGSGAYAFCQYATAASAFDAMLMMDGECVGGSRVKLGFGRPTDPPNALRYIPYEMSTPTTPFDFQDPFYDPNIPDRFPDVATRGFEPTTTNRFGRYDTGNTRVRTPSYSRSSISSVSTTGVTASRIVRYPPGDHYDASPLEYGTERRFRSYDEFGGAVSPADDLAASCTVETRGLQSVAIVARRAHTTRHHRSPHDSSGDDAGSKRYSKIAVTRRPSTELTQGRSHSSERRRRAADIEKHRRRRRRDSSGASRSGTPLRDERPDGPAPAEPRRIPTTWERSQIPMELPLPKFAAEVLRSTPSQPTILPPATAPASPPRAPSASSSSGGEAPDSPSLEERIKSLDEKYEKWSGCRITAAERAERGRFRHRLLELDVNEVQPSEVVRSLLAKRSVFDEDSERLENVVTGSGTSVGSRVPSPPPESPQSSAGRSPYESPRQAPAPPAVPRALQYPFPSHPPASAVLSFDDSLPLPADLASTSQILPSLSSLTPSTPGSDSSDNIPKTNFSVSPIERITFSNAIIDDSTLTLKSVPQKTSSVKVTETKVNIITPLHLVKEPSIVNDKEAILKDSELFKIVNHSDNLDRRKIDSHESRFLRNESETSETEIKDQNNRYKNFPSDMCNKKSSDVEKALIKPSEKISSDSPCCEIQQDVVKDLTPSVNSRRSSVEMLSPLETVEKIKVDSQNKERSDHDRDKGKPEYTCIKNHFKDTADKRLIEKSDGLSRDIDKCVSKLERRYSKDDKLTVNAFEERDKHEIRTLDGRTEIVLLKREKLDRQRIEYEKLEREPEKKGKHQVENVNSESEQTVQEHLQIQRTEKDCKEKERLLKEQEEKNKLKKEHTEAERRQQECVELLEKECLERERLDREEKDRIRKEQEKLENERIEQEQQHIEQERIEKAKIEKAEKERLEKERTAREKADRLKSDKDRSDASVLEFKDSEKEKYILLTDEKQCKQEKRKDKKKEEKPVNEFHETQIVILNKDRRKDKDDTFLNKHEINKSKHHTDKHKKEHAEHKKDTSHKREAEPTKSKERKSSRDESVREMSRKDSSDSTASRNSNDSSKSKDVDVCFDEKEEQKHLKSKSSHENNNHRRHEKSTGKDSADLRKDNLMEKSREKHSVHNEKYHHPDESSKSHQLYEIDKMRHYSLDSQCNFEEKRKERLHSSSSLPANIGFKRRMSSQDSIDSILDETKKVKLTADSKKLTERRDSRHSDKAKHSKPVSKIICVVKNVEDKSRDDKKLTKDLDDRTKQKELKDGDFKEKLKLNDKTKSKKSPKSSEFDAKSPVLQIDLIKFDCNHSKPTVDNCIDKEFLERLELRSSEEDEKQKALRKEMKEKKRLQQLQQIQQFQMQQMQQEEIMNKIKDEKRIKNDERKKDMAREKRMSTERKSREDNSKMERRKPRKLVNSSDTTDSDEPKKHSIFDIVDDEPTYISMYDKVKARSCKNMQKQEEEKRQEKIKAKFSQLKQSRAKREEKKRSTSWDEDSDTDGEQKKAIKSHMSSSEEDLANRKSKEFTTDSETDCDRIKLNNIKPEPIEASDFVDIKNKIFARKNSRARITSDTSDDDLVKKTMDKLKEMKCRVKTELYTDHDFIDFEFKKHQKLRKEKFHDFMGDNIKKEPYDVKDEKCTKESIISHLFKENHSNHSLSIDKKTILNIDIPKIDGEKIEANIKSENKMNFEKLEPLDTSDLESPSHKDATFIESRKKHKQKKQKRQKGSFSEEEGKVLDGCIKSPNDEKNKQHLDKKKHGTKKEKRRDKIRNSTDAEDTKQIDREKLKKFRKSTSLPAKSEGNNSVKRDEKMEDIFGPLSDESDVEVKESAPSNVLIESNNKFISKCSPNIFLNDCRYNIKNLDKDLQNKDMIKEDSKKRKEKKRKDRKIIREDENSLDVDAAGRAIEACLFADTVSESGNQKDSKNNSSGDRPEGDIFRFTDGDDSIESSQIAGELLCDRIKKEIKERKKKKKRNKEDRQNRKDYHYHNQDKHEHIKSDVDLVPTADTIGELFIKTESDVVGVKTVELKTTLQSPSLPRLTDSPPLFKSSNVPFTQPSDTCSLQSTKTTSSPLVSPTHNISNVSAQPVGEVRRPSANFIIGFGSEIDESVSENAIKSISEYENSVIDRKFEKTSSDCELETNKTEKPVEKPRAIISQEETEDAVAALLGESFGRGNSSFTDCYSESAESSSRVINDSPGNNSNIPEEDAEEMRQAVQSLNASELEIKPETPQSENDLQIDTDTEDCYENRQSQPDKHDLGVVNDQNSFDDHSTSDKTSNIDSVISSANPHKLLSPLNIDNKCSKDNVQRSDQKAKAYFESEQTPKMLSVISSPWNLGMHKDKDVSRVINNFQSIKDDKTNPVSSPLMQFKHQAAHSIDIISKPLLISAPRVSAPYQVINHLARPSHIASAQPPMIKIPEQHLIYQRSPNMIMSPRMSNDIHLNSPMSVPPFEVGSPRMTIITGPQALQSPSTPCPPLQQRSPGQLTVVRMQPPLGPVPTPNYPSHSNLSMLSPNRSGTVLVQNQSTSIPSNINRLPVTPVLAPLSKPVITNNVGALQHPKNVYINNGTGSNLTSTKIISADSRKIGTFPESVNTSAKLIFTSQNALTTTSLAQNRLVSIQTTAQPTSTHSGLSLSVGKVVLNTPLPNEKCDNAGIQTTSSRTEFVQTESHNHVPFGQSSIIHISSARQNPGQSGIESLSSRNAFAINSGAPLHQRLLTTLPVTNSFQPEDIKQTSNFSLPYRTPIVAKVEPTVVNHYSSNNHLIPSSCIVTTPKTLLQSIHSQTVQSVNMDSIKDHGLTNTNVISDKPSAETGNPMISKTNEKPDIQSSKPIDVKTDISLTKSCFSTITTSAATKCETDFEELLKDTTNEIKIPKGAEHKLDIPTSNIVSNLATVATMAPSSIDDKCNVQPKNIECSSVNKIGSFNDLPESDNKETNTAVPKEELKEDFWSEKNPSESVIKKLDPLSTSKDINENKSAENLNAVADFPCLDENIKEDSNPSSEVSEDITNKIPVKRGGRIRGGRNKSSADCTVERIQTRHGNKSNRGVPSNRRGRGRSRTDRKIKNSNTSEPNLPGDVYDFHEDSGDESSSSHGNSESRPRLILTIKSPLSATTVQSTTTNVPVVLKEVPSASDRVSPPSALSKDDKSEDFLSPANTRRSRRLVKKDNSRNSVDDIIEDVIKNVAIQTRASSAIVKDVTPVRRSTRQNGAKTNNPDKLVNDVRKSPRASKRNRDRQSSDTSLDSSDEKLIKTDAFDSAPSEPKIAKLADILDVDDNNISPQSKVVSTIVKPPKKMISEISSKLNLSTDSDGSERHSNITPPIEKEIKSASSELEKMNTDEDSDNRLENLSKELNKTPSVKQKLGEPINEELMIDPVTAELVYMKRGADGSLLPVPSTTVAATGLTETVTRPPVTLLSHPSAVQSTSPCLPSQRATPSSASAQHSLPQIIQQTPLASALSSAAPFANQHQASLTRDSTSKTISGIGIPSIGGNSIALSNISTAASSVAIGSSGPVAGAIPDVSGSPSATGGAGVASARGVGGAMAARGSTVAGLPRGAAAPHTLSPLPGANSSRVGLTSIPSISPQGHMTLGDGVYPHLAHQHYPYYRTHDVRATPSPFVARSPLGAEGSEAPSPPLELRRPPSARVPRPAHSPSPSPTDRIHHSYMGMTVPRSPPPAHGGISHGHAIIPAHPGHPIHPNHPSRAGGLVMHAGHAPGTVTISGGGASVSPGPAHGSQVPREADSLLALLRRYPVMWQGLLALKNDAAAVQMHFVHGNPGVAGDTLPRGADGSTPPLRIAQRMRLEPIQLDAVHRKMQLEHEHCMLLALPCGRDHMDVLQQSTNLTAGFITYLQKKQAAGIVNIAPPGHHHPVYTVHVFPSCDFANENLERIAPDLLHRVADIAHLLIVIATV